jgi:alpha-ribazole phosphatase
MEKYSRLYLVRHGQVIGFEELRANGHTDVDITETGRLQMEALAERLRFVDIDIIYSSDLIRTEKGALIIGRHHNKPYHKKRELREIYFGEWEGKSLSEIDKDYPGEFEKRLKDIANYRPPGNGESMEDLSGRVHSCLTDILTENVGSTILIIAHGGVNRLILCKELGMDISNLFNIQQDFGCLNIIDYYPDNALVRLVNG